MDISISVAGKVATADADAKIVCGNSDYEIVFGFDAPWLAYDIKTARFTYQRHGKVFYEEVVFTGDRCFVPVLYDTLEVAIGVYAGDLSTTTAAVVPCAKSILCGDPIHAEPPEDVYNQICEHLHNIDETIAGIVAEISETVGGGA